MVDGFSNCLIELESAHHSPGRKLLQSSAYGSIIISFTSMCVILPHTLRSRRAMMTLLSFTPSSLTTVMAPSALAAPYENAKWKVNLEGGGFAFILVWIIVARLDSTKGESVLPSNVGKPRCTSSVKRKTRFRAGKDRLAGRWDTSEVSLSIAHICLWAFLIISSAGFRRLRFHALSACRSQQTRPSASHRQDETDTGTRQLRLHVKQWSKLIM